MVMARRVGAAPSPALVVSLLLALSIVLPAGAAPLAGAPDAQLAAAPATQAPARAETAVQAAELARAERATATAVRTLYARVYALDGALTSLTAAHELLDLLGATASARYSSGQGEQEALLKAQIEVSRLAERQAELGAQRAAAVAELNRLLDRPGVGALGRVAELPAIGVPAGSWEEQAVAGSPEVAAARAEVEAAARRLALAPLRPPPGLRGRARSRRSRGAPRAVLPRSLGVKLPLWRRRKQQPLVRAAEQELAAARYRVAESEAMARAAAGRPAPRWGAAEAQLRRFREAMPPRG